MKTAIEKVSHKTKLGGTGLQSQISGRRRRQEDRMPKTWPQSEMKTSLGNLVKPGIGRWGHVLSEHRVPLLEVH